MTLQEGQESMMERLGHWAISHPARPFLTFLDRGDKESDKLSFALLHDKATAVGSAFVERGLAGQCVVLAFPSGPDFVVALFACFHAGVIAVPAPYPLQASASARLVGIAQAAGAGTVLLPDVAIGAPAGLTETLALAGLAKLGLDELAASTSSALPPRATRPDDPAFLQFTSGSTASPKGVIITHGNLAANMEMIRTAFGHDDKTRVVSWLPMFHDMGLIGAVLQPVWLGVEALYMTPYAFMQRPMRWLKAVSDFRATSSGAPNFAFDLVAERLERDGPGDLDLSSWHVAFCGAEPVRAATMARFAAAAERAGFDPAALFACYGLAEATLFVSGGPRGYGIKTSGGKSEVSCGPVAAPGQVRIVDPRTGASLPQGKRGEIWVAGPHVSPGYWAATATDDETFIADMDGLSWLRTGDLGEMRDGALHVVGRLKDCIIVRGANFAAEEVQAAIRESDPQLSMAMAAVFNHGEAVVALVECRIRTDLPELREAMARRANAAVTTAFGIRLDRIAFVKPGTLPRTTSGKLRRNKAQAAWAGGDLPVQSLHDFP